MFLRLWYTDHLIGEQFTDNYNGLHVYFSKNTYCPVRIFRM